MSVSGNVTGGRVDRIGSGVRDLLQRADHQHSSPLINPMAISIWRHDTRRTFDALLAAHEQGRLRRATVQADGSTRTGFSARDGLKRATGRSHEQQQHQRERESESSSSSSSSRFVPFFGVSPSRKSSLAAD